MKNIVTVTIPGEQKKSYSIQIGHGIVPMIARQLRRQWKDCTIVVITDSTVRRLYGKDVARKIGATHLVSFPAGEKSKTATAKNFLDEQLLKKGCGRDTLIVALGGGVVGDMAGFVASTYLRGVPYIQVPTTLLAMVDSSIGGKTGIDTPYGKNMIGAFWQPSAVIIDTTFLATLPPMHIQNGLLEAIKMYLACDNKMSESMLGFLRSEGIAPRAAIQNIIRASLAAKAHIVQRDEKESGERMILNFGHTIGHAIEKVSDYSVPHGIAVGYGMLVETHISHELGILPSSALRTVTDVLSSVEIHRQALRKWGARAIIAATKHDKKRRGQQPLYVLLRDIGRPYRKNGAWAHPVPNSIVHKILFHLKAES